jgi:hypothetical protein
MHASAKRESIQMQDSSLTDGLSACHEMALSTPNSDSGQKIGHPGRTPRRFGRGHNCEDRPDSRSAANGSATGLRRLSARVLSDDGLRRRTRARQALRNRARQGGRGRGSGSTGTTSATGPSTGARPPWRRSPGARTPSTGRARNRRGDRPARADDRHQGGMPRGRRAAGHLVPAAPDQPGAAAHGARAAPRPGAAQGACGRRVAGDPRRAAQQPVRRPGPRRSLGDPAGRGRLPRLGLHLLPGAARGRRKPRAPRAGDPPRRDQARARRHRAGPGLLPGHAKLHGAAK